MRILQHNFSMQHHSYFLSIKTTETAFFLERRKVMLRCTKLPLKQFAICQMKDYGAELSVF
jgi:hypothetical protein